MDYSRRHECVALGARIIALRQELNLTQTDLAHLSHIDPSNLGKIERGQANASITTITLIARALDTTVSDLTRDIDPTKVSEKVRKPTAREFLEYRQGRESQRPQPNG